MVHEFGVVKLQEAIFFNLRATVEYHVDLNYELTNKKGKKKKS